MGGAVTPTSNKTLVTPTSIDHGTLVRLARDIAVDLWPLETILSRHNIPAELFDTLKAHKLFDDLVRAELSAWHAATNAQERIKLKAAALLELFIDDDAYPLLTGTDGLAAKNELLKFLGRAAEVGGNPAGGRGEGGTKFSVTINLGGDHKIEIQKTLPPQVIDATAEEIG